MQPGAGVLQGAVIHYIHGETAPAFERALPSARVHLMVNLDEDEFRAYEGAAVHRTKGAVLAGPHSQATIIDTREQRHLITVDFALGSAARFFRTPLSETRDQLVELDQLWGRDGALLREQLLAAPAQAARCRILEAALFRHLVDSRDPDPAIAYAARAFARGVPVSGVSDRLGLLPKTFARRFRKQAGLTPKRFARVRRLQRLVQSVRDPAAADWCQLAAEHGYTDQAHLVHDFRDLTGITPSAYRPRSYEERNHVPL